MVINKGIKVVLLTASLLTLFGCAHKKQAYSSDINDANAHRQRHAQTAGYGEESMFGEEQNAQRNKSVASKRVYYFDFDSNIVHDEDKPAIQANAKFLAAHPDKKLLVEGHTDPRGSREYNIGLGERRAKAIVAMLVSQGINADQIRVVSYGAQKLAALGHTESDYQLNRRVALIYS